MTVLETVKHAAIVLVSVTLGSLTIMTIMKGLFMYADFLIGI